MGWDALHLSLLKGGSKVTIKGSETWLCYVSPVFPLKFCIFEVTVQAKCAVKQD